MRFSRFLAPLLAVVLAAQPAFADQQAVNTGTGAGAANGDTLRVSFTKLNANDAELYARIATIQQRLALLGGVANLNVGTTAGTVADGGALTSEIARAKAAEQANATNIATNVSAISTETSRAQGIEATLAPKARQIVAGTGLAGGGDLTADRTLSFASVPTGSVLANVSGSTAVPGATTPSTLLDVLGATRGAILFRGASGWSTMAPGTTGYALVSNGAGADPSFQAVSGGSGGVPTSRQILASGLATGGGDLTADRTITVPKAAQSDVAAGTDDAKALTSLSVAARLGSLAPLASPQFTGTGNFASGSGQFPVALTIQASTHATSRRAVLSLDNWSLIQDTGASGTKDFGLFSAALNAFPVTVNTAGVATFAQSPTAPTPAAADNSIKLATTAYADRAAANVAATSGAAVNYSRAFTGALGTITAQTAISDAAPTTSNTSSVVSVSHTPKAAGNTLHVRAVLSGSLNGQGTMVGAIFQGSATSAGAARASNQYAANFLTEVVVDFWVAAPSTAAITFTLAGGANNGNALTVNGTAGSRQFGGVMTSHIEVTETLP